MSKEMYNQVPIIGNEYDKNQWKQIATHSTLQISGFFGEYRFLSNFWPASIVFEGRVYPTVENAYQSMKFSKSKSSFFETCSPADSKIYSNEHENEMVWTPHGWDTIKIFVMRELLYKKFSAHHPELRDKLIATGFATLTETNWWRDTFWGKYTTKRNVLAVGENHLGELLMEVRASL